MGIAFFDFDGTISTADSFLAFIRYTAGRKAYWRGMALLSPWVILYGLKLLPNWRLKEKVFGYFFGGKSAAEIQQAGEAFSTDYLPRICRPKVLARIKWHQLLGHKVIVLTASSSTWLHGWCEAQNVELIGSEFAVKGGRYTGKLDGPNCHGIRKAEIVAQLLSQEGYTDTYGYGNSRHDAPFLSLLQRVNTIPVK